MKKIKGTLEISDQKLRFFFQFMTALQHIARKIASLPIVSLNNVNLKINL